MPKACLTLAIAGVALLLSTVVLNILAYNHVRSMMFYTDVGERTSKPEELTLGQKIRTLIVGVNIPRPHEPMTPEHVGLDFESLTLPGTDGVTLGAWYCPREGAETLVVLFHGYSKDKSSLLPEAKVLHELGVSVLLVDFRGSGESSESYTTVGYIEAEDVAAAVGYAQENIPHEKLILFGQSMGAAAILRAIHVYGLDPDAVIVEAVFDSLLTTIRNRFDAMGIPSFPSAELMLYWGKRAAGFNGFEHNPAVYAQSVHCPILFMHGRDDPRAKIDEARRVYDAVNGPKEFKEFPLVGHESYVVRFPEEWRQKVTLLWGRM